MPGAWAASRTWAEAGLSRATGCGFGLFRSRLLCTCTPQARLGTLEELWGYRRDCHKIPRSKGGPGEEDNAQVLCRDCNLKKGDKDPAPEEAQ